MNAVLAVCLDPVHRVVGACSNCSAVPAPPCTVASHRDRQPHLEPLGLEEDVRRDPVPDALGHGVRAVAVGVGEHDRELVAAVARHHVRLRAQRRSTDATSTSAGSRQVAVAVVHLLEGVDVDEQHGQGPPRADRALALPAQGLAGNASCTAESGRRSPTAPRRGLSRIAESSANAIGVEPQVQQRPPCPREAGRGPRRAGVEAMAATRTCRAGHARPTQATAGAPAISACRFATIQSAPRRKTWRAAASRRPAGRARVRGRPARSAAPPLVGDDGPARERQPLVQAGTSTSATRRGSVDSLAARNRADCASARRTWDRSTRGSGASAPAGRLALRRFPRPSPADAFPAADARPACPRSADWSLPDATRWVPVDSYRECPLRANRHAPSCRLAGRRLPARKSRCQTTRYHTGRDAWRLAPAWPRRSAKREGGARRRVRREGGRPEGMKSLARSLQAAVGRWPP